MHSCHHAYRYIFLSCRRRDNRFFFFFRLLGLFIMLILVFLSWPEEGERGKGIRDWVCRSGGIEGAW